LTDSLSAAQLAFGRRVSFRGARKLGSTLLGRAVSGHQTSRVTHRKPAHHKRKGKHAMPTHHRRNGVVIPNEMLKMLVFASVIRAIRD